MVLFMASVSPPVEKEREAIYLPVHVAKTYYVVGSTIVHVTTTEEIMSLGKQPKTTASSVVDVAAGRRKQRPVQLSISRPAGVANKSQKIAVWPSSVSGRNVAYMYRYMYYMIYSPDCSLMM